MTRHFNVRCQDGPCKGEVIESVGNADGTTLLPYYSKEKGMVMLARYQRKTGFYRPGEDIPVNSSKRLRYSWNDQEHADRILRQ